MIDKLTVEGVEYHVIYRYFFNKKEDITEDIMISLKDKHNAEKAIIGTYDAKFIFIVANIIEDAKIVPDINTPNQLES